MSVREFRRSAPIFAALGDRTRLILLAKLSDGSSFSISRLTLGSSLTRQAITKHLRILQLAGLVRSTRRGRESVFELDPKPLGEARRSLDWIAQSWDVKLARLKALVER